MDWFVVPLLASQVSFAGHVRYILKNTLRLMPWYGWYFEEHGCIYVRKNFLRDQTIIANAMRRLAARPTPFWMAIFPEGTRFSGTAACVAGNQEFAKSRGLPLLSEVLLPRTKGFGLCVQSLRSRIAAVYDVTIAYSKANATQRPGAPSMADLMSGQYPVVHVYLKRFPVAELPADDALAEWITERFVAKDRLLRAHYGGDNLDTQAWTHAPPPMLSWARAAVWTMLLAPLLLTPSGRFLWMGLACGSACGVVIMLPQIF